MLSEFRKRKVKRIFEFYDVNANGFIETSDIHAICDRFCEEYGWAKESDMDKMFRSQFLTLWSALVTAADVNKDSKVSLDELYANYTVTIKDEAAFEKYIYPFFQGIYPVLDSDSDGDMGFDEFSRFYRSFRNTDAQAQVAFSTQDLNGDGILTRDEFLLNFYLFHMSENEAHSSRMFFGAM